MMKKYYSIIILVSIIASLSASKAQNANGNGYLVKVGDIAPDFEVNEAGGKSYKLSDLRGSVVMLQFTASWCGVCRKEMPFIEKDIWQVKKQDGLRIIGIDRDEPEKQVIKFAKVMAITYPLALDPGGRIFGLYAEKKSGVTRNVIIDRSGKIIFLTRLFEPEEFDQMKKAIFSELEKK